MSMDIVFLRFCVEIVSGVTMVGHQSPVCCCILERQYVEIVSGVTIVGRQSPV